MKKHLLYLAIVSLLFPAVLQAQRTRQASCANQSSAHWYITPYGGIGAAWYSYELNGTIINPDGKTIEKAETNTLMTVFFGVQSLYRFSAINLGIGGEWEGFSGKVNNGISKFDLNLYYFKIYGRIEAPLYSDSFNDFGAYANIGAVIPNRAFGEQASPGGFIDLGIYYNLILNQSSSFLFGLGYQQAGFHTTIGQSVSKHTQKDLRLSLAYRFWF